MKQTALTSLYALGLADCATVEQWLRLLVLLAPLIVAIIHACRRPPRRETKRSRSKLPLVFAPIAASLLLLLSSGCVKSSMAQLVQAMGSDTNAVSIQVTSPWGSVDVRRNVR